MHELFVDVPPEIREPPRRCRCRQKWIFLDDFAACDDYMECCSIGEAFVKEMPLRFRQVISNVEQTVRHRAGATARVESTYLALMISNAIILYNVVDHV